jgi:hypothetical protein
MKRLRDCVASTAKAKLQLYVVPAGIGCYQKMGTEKDLSGINKLGGGSIHNIGGYAGSF